MLGPGRDLQGWVTPGDSLGFQTLEVPTEVHCNPDDSYWFDNPGQYTFWLDLVMALGKTGFTRQLP